MKPGPARVRPAALDFAVRHSTLVASDAGLTEGKVEGFKDPAQATRLAVMGLYAYMLCDAFGALLKASLPFKAASTEIGPLSVVVGVAILDLIAFFICVVLVGCWIYRTNANAHLFSDGMTISPGWAVGWYFVPFANLVKPYQGMRETWLASHYRDDWGAGEEPVMMRCWWLLWIVTNILSNVVWRMANTGAGEGAVEIVDLIDAGLNVALCLVLIELMQRLAAAQIQTAYGETFA